MAPPDAQVTQRLTEMVYPVTLSQGQPGYPLALDVGYPTVTQSRSSLQYEVTVTNNTGARAAIPYQSIAFFANDGTLLLVWNVGPRASLADGESYLLTGSLPLDQPVEEGRRLDEYTDVLAGISAEVAP